MIIMMTSQKDYYHDTHADCHLADTATTARAAADKLGGE